jgi:acetylxylan esterase
MHLSSSLLVRLALAATAVDGALMRITNFGSNPTNLQMNINIPSKLAQKPAIILAVRTPRALLVFTNTCSASWLLWQW